MSSSMLPPATEENLQTNLSMGQNDERHPVEAVLNESKRLIKAGLYKKAFQIIENHKPELQNVSVAANIKLHRRMVICLTRICDRYLVKDENIKRTDHFLRLMNKKFEYIETWHNLLCSYISKTNPKYVHLQKILDEVSDSYDDGFEFGNAMRLAKGRKDMTVHNNTTSFMSTNESTKPSTFLNKFKQSTIIGRNRAAGGYLEDLTNTEGSRLQTTDHMGQPTQVGGDLNATFHLDEFIKYFMNFLLSWVTFYKKNAKKYDIAYRFLSMGYRISKILDACLDPDTLQVVAKVRIALGVFFLEFGRAQEALLVFESAVNILHSEISLRLGRARETQVNLSSVLKLKATVRLLIITFINMSICYELQDNYARVVETLKLGIFFANRFTTHDDEMYSMISSRYDDALEKYDAYLKELGEIERVMVEQNVSKPTDEQIEEATTEHFLKINSYLYDKFDYDKLNTSQAIVFTSPEANRRDSVVRITRAEFLLDERNDTTDGRHNFTRQDMSMGRTHILSGEGFDSPNWKQNSTIINKSGLRGKKKQRSKRLHSMGPDEFGKPLTSEKYRTNTDIEKETLNIELNHDDEQHYIEELNRNIKDKSKSLKHKNEKNYLDLDKYFEKVIEEKIQTKEEEMNLKPISFKQMIKNYAYFDKSECFDKVEFSFAAKTLTAKSRENLSGYTVTTKYKPPPSKISQFNEVKIEAQLLEARNEAESKVMQKNASSKGFLTAKSSNSKNVKFAPLDTDVKTSLAQINESAANTTRNPSSKATFSNIMLKHKEQMGLNNVNSAVKDMEKIKNRERKVQSQKQEFKLLGLNNASPQATTSTLIGKGPHITTPRTEAPEIDPERSKKNAENANNMIQLLMEGIEKTIENDVNIRKRIEESKPLVEAKKVSTRFLKVPDELARSTNNLSLKLDGGKKNWSFNGVVKGVQAMRNKIKMGMAAGDL